MDRLRLSERTSNSGHHVATVRRVPRAHPVGSERPAVPVLRRVFRVRLPSPSAGQSKLPGLHGRRHHPAQHRSPADAACRRRIFVATAQSQLFALDARDGKPAANSAAADPWISRRVCGFRLRAAGLFDDVAAASSSTAWSSPVPRSPTTAGPTRRAARCAAFDARTGALKWTWDPIPQDRRTPRMASGAESWRQKGGGANAWSVSAADPERDLVFVPTGSAGAGLLRRAALGDNRYANSIVALKASTGRVAWSFQTVHHDLWDYDNASPPALSHDDARWRARAGGAPGEQERHAVRAQPRDRRADLSGRGARRSGRATSRPSRHRGPNRSPPPSPPLSPHRFTVDQVWGMNDADRAACRAADRGTAQRGDLHAAEHPRHAGDAVEYRRRALGRCRRRSGAAGRRRAGQPPGAMVQLHPARGTSIWPASRAAEQRLGDDYEYNFMRGTPYVMRRRMLLSPSRTAVHAAAVRHACRDRPQDRQPSWEVPLGTIAALIRRHGSGASASGVAQPWRSDRHGRRAGVHRRGAGSVPSRLRHRDRPRSLARAAARKRQGDADELSARLGRTVRGDRRRWRRRLGRRRLRRRISPASRVGFLTYWSLHEKDHSGSGGVLRSRALRRPLPTRTSAAWEKQARASPSSAIRGASRTSTARPTLTPSSA